MTTTVEAVSDELISVHLPESVSPGGVRRALVTILEERPAQRASDRALLGEAALAEDWVRLEDLSRSELRPAVVLADAGRGDHVLCHVTSRTDLR